MVDVVGAKARAHQLLEQVGLLVRTLGRAKPGERRAAGTVSTMRRLGVADAHEARGGEFERLVPARFAKQRRRIARIEFDLSRLRDPGLADQRLGQPVRVVRVIETVASLDAQPAMVRRPVLAGDEFDPVVRDVVGQQAADAAERAHRVHRAIDRREARLARRRERAGRTGLHALAAGDTGRIAHRIVEVEHDLRVLAAKREADDIVHLRLAAGTQAARALDAGIELDRDRRMRQVGRGLHTPREARQADAERTRPVIDLVLARVAPLGQVGEQQFEHHLLRRQRAR